MTDGLSVNLLRFGNTGIAIQGSIQKKKQPRKLSIDLSLMAACRCEKEKITELACQAEETSRRITIYWFAKLPCRKTKSQQR